MNGAHEKSSNNNVVATKTPTTTPSVAKTLSDLLSQPSNRTCADCRTPMVDSSQTFACLSPSLDEMPSMPQQTLKRRRANGIPDFTNNHQAFSPDSDTRKEAQRREETDAASLATNLVGGHGVFVCRACAKAHKYLGPSISIVKSANDYRSFSSSQVEFLRTCGCNKASWNVYEAFVPPEWNRKKPSGKSSVENRLIFCKAKYEALAFVTPLGGPLAEKTWISIVLRERELQRYLPTGSMTSFLKLSMKEADHVKAKETPIEDHDALIPKRFVDFFCVVGQKKELYPGEKKKNLYRTEGPESITLMPNLTDCYPRRDFYADTEFPEHVSQFVFPEGCRPSETQQAPSLMTFVLTSSSGHRLFGAALRIYDETMETSDMKGVLAASGYTVPLPWWLSDLDNPPEQKDGRELKKPSDIVFLPKCLVVFGHYPFFEVFRHFLKQLYRISLIETPLPIERYISNFISELPLPPQGKVEVKFGFASDVQCAISRPAPNELPLVNFSYLPLFSSLSVSNILIVMGCLLDETKIVILSKHLGLLTPCCEAFISFLFPFEFQGIYIPIVPFSALDILEAPVPFLLGLHSRYLLEVPIDRRPQGVVFVDLDKDIVHLGFEETTGTRADKRPVPALPEKSVGKLKKRLEELTEAIYLTPQNGTKGMVTFGRSSFLSNSIREPYARQEKVEPTSPGSTTRKSVLTVSEDAYPETQVLQPIVGLYSEEGQLSAKSGKDHHSDRTGTPSRKTRLKKMINKIDTNVRGTSHSSSEFEVSLKYLHDMEEASQLLDVQEIRNAFLRFFTSLFNNYEKYIEGPPGKESGGGDIFRSEDFLADLRLPQKNRRWVERVLQTQLFQHYLEQRLEDPHDAHILFFDESIVAKNNRSVKQTLMKQKGKMTTPFLDDASWKVTEIFTPPAPSTLGLPADGNKYSYSTFPTLSESLFGNVRTPKRWPDEWEKKIRRGASKSLRAKRVRLVHAVLSPDVLSPAPGQPVPTLLAKIPSQVRTKDLSWALVTSAHGCELPAKVDSSLRSLSIEDCAEVDSPPADDAATAEELILASRRKQGILILRIVKLQACARKFLCRSDHARHLAAAKLAQNVGARGDVEMIASSLLVLRRVILAYLALKRRNLRDACVRRIQRIVRGFLARVLASQIRASIHMQAAWRGKYVRNRLKRYRIAVMRTQAAYRGGRVRFALGLAHVEASKLQAFMRTFITKKQVYTLLQRQQSRYLQQVFVLWKRARTPLTYRSQMWPIFKPTFFGCRILSDELQRLWTLLEIEISQHQGIASDDTILQEMNNLGLSVNFEWKFLQVEEVLHTARNSKEDSDFWFPGENSERGQKYSSRLSTEMLQVYEKLNRLDHSPSLVSVYACFGIAVSERKKKARVIDLLWKTIDFAGPSSKAMLELYPELSNGSEIEQFIPSKKGLARLHHKKAVLLTPLDKSLWVDRKMDHLYREDLSAVAMACLGTLPHLSIKLHEAHVRKTKELQRMKAAMLHQDKWSNWSECMTALVQNVLYSKSI